MRPSDAVGHTATMEAVTTHYARLAERRVTFKSSVPNGRPPAFIRKALMRVPAPVTEHFAPTAVPLPAGVDGLAVLDLACGSGRDSYVAAALVGEKGTVVGVDPRPHLLEVATGALGEFAAKLGRPPALKLLRGYPENLEDAGVPAGSIDLCISSGAVNLSPRLDLLLASAYRALREGGELYFIAVVCDRRLTEAQREHEGLVAEGLASAPYDQDLVRLCQAAGFADPREVTRMPVVISDAKLRAAAGAARFSSVTYRCFKLASLEPGQEDYGQTATYLGTLPGAEAAYPLDRWHTLPAHEPVAVCGNTAAMLSESWLRAHFAVAGDRVEHRGPFRSDAAKDDDGNDDLALAGAMMCANGVCALTN